MDIWFVMRIYMSVSLYPFMSVICVVIRVFEYTHPVRPQKKLQALAAQRAGKKVIKVPSLIPALTFILTLALTLTLTLTLTHTYPHPKPKPAPEEAHPTLLPRLDHNPHPPS